MPHFKLIIFYLFLLTKALTAFSQSKADSISVTFPKILVINDKREILLAFDNNRMAYEVPSIGLLKGPISFKSYVDTFANKIGLVYKSFRLGGIFTYTFPDQYSTYIRPYFVVQFNSYANGQSFSKSTYKWFSLNNALKEIKYPASAEIVRKIMKEPKHVWSATFEEYGYTNPVDVSKIKFRIIENFFKLN